MSHFTTVKTKIRDQQVLVEALGRLVPRWAGHVETHETPAHLWGYENRERPELAHVVVRRKYVGGASNDIGFVRGEDGNYQAIISDYDRRHYNADWLKSLTRTYAELKVVKEVTKRHLRIAGQKIEGSRVIIQVYGN